MWVKIAPKSFGAVSRADASFVIPAIIAEARRDKMRPTMQLSIADATQLATHALTRAGLTPDHARIIADHLVDANLCGHEFSSLPRVLAIAHELSRKAQPAGIRVTRETPSS